MDGLFGTHRVEFYGWAEQEPADVARQLTDAALMLANVLDRLGRLSSRLSYRGPDTLRPSRFRPSQPPGAASCSAPASPG